jgi:hypothetical protein
VSQWVENYRRHWEQRLDRLDDYLRDSAGKAAKRAHSRKSK